MLLRIPSSSIDLGCNIVKGVTISDLLSFSGQVPNQDLHLSDFKQSIFMPKKLPTFKNIVNIVLRGFLPLIDYHMQSLKYNGNIFNNVIESAIIVNSK